MWGSFEKTNMNAIITDILFIQFSYRTNVQNKKIRKCIFKEFWGTISNADMIIDSSILSRNIFTTFYCVFNSYRRKNISSVIMHIEISSTVSEPHA